MRNSAAYCPERKPTKALIYLLCLFVIGISCCAVGSGDIPFKWLFQLAALFCLVLFILSVTRYFIYEYRYLITDDSFVVVQKSGKRETVLCNLNLSMGIGVYTSKEYKAQKKNIGHIKTAYNYTQNFMNDNKLYYVFEFNGDKFCVALEADDNFAAALKDGVTQER